MKIQYPGAGKALLGDLKQLGRLARVFAVFTPGLDIKPLLKELEARVAEELDYRLEAESQSTFAAAYAGDPDICVPPVVAGADLVLVTEWIEGIPLSGIIREGTTEQRDRASRLLATFLFSGPVLAGLLHADPHPGNFRLLRRRAARRHRLRRGQPPARTAPPSPSAGSPAGRSKGGPTTCSRRSATRASSSPRSRSTRSGSSPT